jgi:hypothetical protein
MTMSTVITREMLTDLMTDRETILEKVNAFICPHKNLQSHKGARLDGIHTTPEGYWSALIFPQWVVCEPSYVKSYRFICDENGKFIKWVYYEGER